MAKIINPITKSEIEKANEPGMLFDGNGLQLEIKPNGSKLWRFRYAFQGERRLMSLGAYPLVSLADARSKREEFRRLLINGIDPQLNRKLAEAVGANTFEAVAREWHSEFKQTWTPEHGDRILRRLEVDIFPHLGKRQVSEIEAPELLQVIRKIQKRGALETAHRALTNVGQVFRYAVQTGRAKRDPAQDLRGAIPPVAEKHLAAILDPQKLGTFLRAAEEYRGGVVVTSALRLAPMLAVRPGELRIMEWAQVDLAAGEWRFIASKTRREMVVPLPRQAVEILSELRRLTGDGKYVFPTPRTPDGSRPMSENAVLVALRAMGYSSDELTGHGFRATFRTLGAEVLEFRAELLEHQLGHAVRDPLGRAYNRTSFLRERKEMMQKWADYLDTLKGGKA